jgi:HEAT repeat protein/S1-C subfamily serine protease
LGGLAVALWALGVGFGWLLKRPADAPGPERTPKPGTIDPLKEGFSDAGEQAYLHLLKCTALLKSSTGHGTGVLVDRTNRLVLTNCHVVETDEVAVAFPPPTYTLKARVDSRSQLPQPHDFLRGVVVWRDSTRDLAIVRLERLPEHVLPLALAPDSAREGQDLHLVGNPRRMQDFWVYTPGKVQKVRPAEWSVVAEKNQRDWAIDTTAPGNRNPRKQAAWVVEAHMRIHRGDSGGPVVDDDGDLVALSCGFRADVQDVAWCIDVREVRYVLQGYEKAWGGRLDLRPSGLAGGTRRKRQGLLLALQDKDALTRAEALLNLGNMGAGARHTLPLLIPMLKDPDSQVRSSARGALEKIGPPAADQVALLVECLKDPCPQVRAYAVTALGQLGPAAGHVLTDLDRLLRDPEVEVRRNVFLAWKEIGLAADSLTPALFAAWDDAPADVRESLTEALADVTPENEGAMPVLLQALQVHDVTVRQSAAAAVAQFGQAGKAALAQSAYPVLLKLLAEDGSSLVRREAAVAVVAVDPAGQKAVPLLARALRADKELRLQAAISLKTMGPAAEAAVPELIAVLKDPEPEFHQQVVAALGGIGPAAKSAVPILIEEVQNSARRSDALAALVKIGAPAVPALDRALQKRSLRPARKEIAEALGEIGPPAKTAVNTLLRLHGDRAERMEVRQAAWQAKRRIQGQ